jgi:hypothetical protein
MERLRMGGRMGCGQTCLLGAGMKKRVDTQDKEGDERENVLDGLECDFTEKVTNVR